MVDWIMFIRFNWSAFINWIAAHIEYAAHDAFPNRHGNRLPGIRDLIAALHSLGTRHRDCANPSVSKVLLYFKGGRHRFVLNFVPAGKCVVDSRQCSRELDVHYRAKDPYDFSLVQSRNWINSRCQHFYLTRLVRRQSPTALW